MIKEKNLNQNGYFIYATTGTYDGIKHQMDTQMEEMLKRNHFFTKDKVVYYMKKNGSHDLESVEELLGTNVDKHDLERIAYGVSTDEKDFHKRPLSKFCADIIKQEKID